jgi:hypothetical protein
VWFRQGCLLQSETVGSHFVLCQQLMRAFWCGVEFGTKPPFSGVSQHTSTPTHSTPRKESRHSLKRSGGLSFVNEFVRRNFSGIGSKGLSSLVGQVQPERRSNVIVLELTRRCLEDIAAPWYTREPSSV